MRSLPKSGNLWPLVISAWFVFFFAGLVAFIVFSTHHREDLVRSDYYEEEIRFQRQLERVARTQSLEGAAKVAYDMASGWITIQLPQTHAAAATGRVLLYRPSDAGLDREIKLATDTLGVQRLDATRLRAGLWNVRVLWQVDAQEFYLDQRIVVPGPTRS